jgi:hypothetical protein
MTSILIPTRFTDGTIQNAQLSYDEDSERCFLALLLHQTPFSAEATDYFEALAQIRVQLERNQIQLLCYGASRCVYPSGMGRDMGQGLRAYKLKLGQYARTIDLVDIFTSEPDVEPATVYEQHACYGQWLTSIQDRAKQSQ